MFRLRTSLAPLLVTLLFLASARAQEPIRFGRTPDISPDGSQVAFSYLGDVWIVNAIGGLARPVTMHAAHDIDPVFSPDGRWLAFSSNRHGSYDVFVVSALGGRPRRLTYDSAADIVSGWSPDGKSILFTSTRDTSFPPTVQLYSVPFEGGRVKQITFAEGKDGVYSPKGDQIAYVRGPGTWYRRGYRGSSNDDIWLCNADGTHNRRVTDFNGLDNSPMWSTDGRTLYYVSEHFGTPANIVRRTLGDPAREGTAGLVQQLTFHKDDGVRRARLSGNGEWIVYECGADLWVVSTKGGTPRKLAIEVHADDKVNPERTVTLTQGASEYALTYDERHLAFVVHGQMFLMSITGGKATALADDPSDERHLTSNNHGLSWSRDMRKLLFISDRNGYDDLYLLESDDPDHAKLTEAHKFKTKQLTNTPEAEAGGSFSPDGRRIAFLRAGKLWTMNPDGSGEKALVNEVQVFDYDWSPDGKYLVYARRDGSFASDLYIIPVTGGSARNITRYGTYNGGVSWSLRGKKIAFISERRRNQPSLFVLSLQKPSAPGASSSNDIDWEDIHQRVEQPAPLPAEEGAISTDGNQVAFRASTQGSEDLWVATTDGSRLTRLTTGNQKPQQIQWSRLSSDLIYFRDRSGTLRTARAGGSQLPELFRTGRISANSGSISFSAKITLRREEEFSEMFEQSWRALYEEFYDPQFHGSNWMALRLKYRPLVQHVALREDFYSLVSLMLGELNASHLGIMGYTSPPEERTADLGLLYDESYRGPGLKVAEVLKRGPADKRGIDLKSGDIIHNIDGVALDEKANLSKLLNAKEGETVVLQVERATAASKLAQQRSHEWRIVLQCLGLVTQKPTFESAAQEKPHTRRVEVQAASRHTVQELMYDRWIAHNAQRVAELSGGRLGYIHIPSMDEEGLDRFVRALYSDSFDKDAIVLDVRYNGGGFTHDQVLNYLGGRDHTFFRQRDGGQGVVMRSFDRKWTKPLVLLINNRSYSDAEIFPSAFRTLGLGKLVGQPTGAHVIGTTAVRLIDGSVFRIPHVGVFTPEGTDMEKQGVMPDVVVDQLPDQMAAGIDPQLDKAVEVLQKDVVAWKKSHPNLARKPEEKTAAAVPAVRAK
jgi:tricorn protease